MFGNLPEAVDDTAPECHQQPPTEGSIPEQGVEVDMEVSANDESCELHISQTSKKKH